MNLKQHVLHTLQTQPEWSETAKILVAVSGGLDSMVLLHILKQLNLNVVVAHANFGLRGIDSTLDEDLVRRFCLTHNIPFFIRQFSREHDLPDENNTQQWARKLRYQWFNQLAEQEACTFILTAHHANDQVETVLLHLLRGAGLAQLPGMLPRQGKIVRPLLTVSKSALDHYRQIQDVPYREDASNAKTDYLRNALRHSLLPLLEELKPGSVSTILHAQEHWQPSAAFYRHQINLHLQTLIQQRQDGVQVLRLSDLQQHPHAQVLLYEWLSPFGFQSAQCKSIYETRSHFNAQQFYAKNHALERTREGFELRPILDSATAVSCVVDVRTAGNLKLPDAPGILHWQHVAAPVTIAADRFSCYLDADLVGETLHLRPWQAADRIQPFGMQGKHKLISDLLNEQKLSANAKKQVRVLCTLQGEVVWLVGVRSSEAFKINTQTQRVLIVQVRDAL